MTDAGERGLARTGDEPVSTANVPDRIAIDAAGFGWRVWDGHDHWSMVPTNPDNSPIPRPVTWFVPEPAVERVGWLYNGAQVHLHEHAWDDPTYAPPSRTAEARARTLHRNCEPVYRLIRASNPAGEADGA